MIIPSIFDSVTTYLRVRFIPPGFFYCCPSSLSKCDGHTFYWPAIPKTQVTADEARHFVDISVSNSLCPDGALPYWIGYAFCKIPFRKDFDAPIYAATDQYKLPAALWRCKVVVSEEILDETTQQFGGCVWKKIEQYDQV